MLFFHSYLMVLLAYLAAYSVGSSNRNGNRLSDPSVLVFKRLLANFDIERQSRPNRINCFPEGTKPVWKERGGEHTVARFFDGLL